MQNLLTVLLSLVVYSQTSQAAQIPTDPSCQVFLQGSQEAFIGELVFDKTRPHMNLVTSGVLTKDELRMADVRNSNLFNRLVNEKNYVAQFSTTLTQRTFGNGDRSQVTIRQKDRYPEGRIGRVIPAAPAFVFEIRGPVTCAMKLRDINNSQDSRIGNNPTWSELLGALLHMEESSAPSAVKTK